MSVLGGKPGTVGSGIPGPKVGYMPQEIALVGEFTVKDAIFYFGRIFHMAEKNIEERFYELSNLLNLPDENQFIKNCSGGQQRRVSFAAAMVHLPELLILDEPTVGVDPVLREKIWDYLVTITSERGISVIITTHYIEETKQANLVSKKYQITIKPLNKRHQRGILLVSAVKRCLLIGGGQKTKTYCL